MKKLIIATLFVLSSVFLFASYSNANSQLDHDYCGEWSSLAEQIMINRQSGVPLSDTFNAAGGIESIEVLVLIAYNTPRFHTGTEIVDVIEAFRDRVYYECLRTRRNRRLAL